VNSLGNRDRDLADYPYDDNPQDTDREISLGTGTILGIFFALVLVCALCFGFGYSIGRRSAAPTTNAAGAAGSAQSSTDGDSGSLSKPRSGSPFQTGPEAAGKTTAATSQSDQPDQSSASGGDGQADSQTGSQTGDSPDSHLQDGQKSSPQDASSITPAAAAVIRQSQQAAVQNAVQNGARNPAAQPVALHPAAKSGPAASSPAPPAALPAVSSSGTAMVQIAAVSHQEDADLLLAALKKRGYPVFVRQEPQDHLLHIQVGPFATRKDAETVRQHLLTDGYNAILK
jgi:DedD protein